MKKLFRNILLSALLPASLAMADAVIFSGTDVLALKQHLDLNRVAKILTGTADPSSSAPESCPQGSLYLRTGGSGGTVWAHTSSGADTNWSQLVGGTAVSSVGTIDSSAANANGATISGTELRLQSEDATHPGLINNSAQTISGAKTFSSTIIGSINGNAATVTTNANLTGPITSSGNATSIASQTGTGTKFVMDTSPSLVTPSIGAATGTSLSVSGQLTSTVSTGTAPLVVSSTTQVANLNAATAGSATNATNSTNIAITDDTTTNATMLPVWVTTNTGNLPANVSSTKFTANPSTGAFTATTFIGAVTGTATGNTTYSANNHGVVLSSATNAMTVIAPNSSTAFPLISGGASADPTWALLGVAGGGTGLATLTAHALQVGAGTSTPVQLAAAGAGKFLRAAGTSSDPAYSTATLPDTAVDGDILYASATNTWSSLAKGSDTQVLTLASGHPSWASVATTNPTEPSGLFNVGLVTSVSASAMTVALKQSDGSTDPSSGTAAAVITYHSSTAATGGYSAVSTTAALSVVIPSGATLGHTSAINQYVWVYAINNAGATELAVSGVKLFPDNSIQSTTTIGAGSTSGTVMYSTTGRTNVAIRLIGRALVNESTAGTWASNATEVIVNPRPVVAFTESDKTTYALAFTGLGTVSVNNVYCWRDKARLFCDGTVTPGTATAVALTIDLPSGVVIDTSKASGTTSAEVVGHLHYLSTGATSFAGATVGPLPIFFDGSTNNHLYVAASATSGALNKSNGSTIFGANAGSIKFDIPIAGWSTFGP